MTRALTVGCCLILLPPQAAPLARLTFTAPSASYGVLRFRLDDASSRAAVAAVDVFVDGRKEQLVVVTPGTKRPGYDALLGPLGAGVHDIRLEPSSLWAWDASLRLLDSTVEVVAAEDTRSQLFGHAPALGLRPDTIGSSSDLPLMMYVEETRDGGTLKQSAPMRGSRWLRYTVIFSNEDGGTAGSALMARWGRTTDIELAYEVEIQDGTAIQARYQGPDHRMLPRARPASGPPTLIVSTLNNMFFDRGHAPAVVRMVPELVDLSGRSRESMMDERPWIYRVMARELAQERPAGVGDPRDYVYVDLNLDSRSAGIALGARSADGTTRWSDRGRADLVVSRQGEMRIAIPAPAAENIIAVLVRCDPRAEPSHTADTAICHTSIRKAFRLNRDYEPGISSLKPIRLAVDVGTAREVALEQPSRDRGDPRDSPVGPR